ncbi:MAG: gfo/Idh/MocA family oxidoreductase, partial [Planctomycetota bacterium]|nr:gfo/Idh/MocA family oxidoreductase [Planctomycetota bacterium]
MPMEPAGDRSVRLGFIGAGGIALHHMEQLASLGGVSFRAHCDVDRSRAGAAAARFGGEVCADYRKLLERD